MTRRVALACSFALTVVVSFAVVTLGSSAGWFGGETEASTAVAPLSQDSQPGLSATPQVIVVDIPVVTAPAQRQQPVVASQQPPARQTAYRDDDRSGDDRYDDRDDDDDRHGDDDRHDDDHGDDDDDDGGHGGRGRDHPEDD